ncbi:hypothetical protein AB0I69_28335 [Streptomyces sp. NPDC050508]|uniref:hypothetical protein n=1 Tax=Streptomyces sp. NPDC050508 TaxID=3155405 RepID=UPI0034448E3E
MADQTNFPPLPRTIAAYEKPAAADSAEAVYPDTMDTYLGGLIMGYRWPAFFIEAGRDHEAVGFAGYPLGGITMRDALFGPVQLLCKGGNRG